MVSGGACFVKGVIRNSEFFENHAHGTGGAVAAAMNARTTLEHCTLVRNRADGGGHAAAVTEDSSGMTWISTVASHGIGGPATVQAPGTTIDFTCSDIYDPVARDDEFFEQIGANGNFSADPVLCWDDSATAALSRDSWCQPDHNSCAELIGAPGGAETCSTSGAYVQTVPPILQVTGDGETRNAAAYFRWPDGTTHTISVSSPQDLGSGVQSHFDSWDDGGALAHQIKVSRDRQVYTARFDSLLWLSVEVGVAAGGTVTPESQWSEPGAEVQITAIPNPGWTFGHWEGTGEGSYTGSDSSATVTVLSPIVQTAIFVPGPTRPVRVVTEPSGLRFRADGVWYTAPHDFVWDLASIHGVRIDELQIWAPGERQRFTLWSTGSTERSLVYAADNPDPDTLAAYFDLEYQLAFNAGEGGTITPAGAWLPPDTELTIEAVPDFGYAFVRWAGIGDGSYDGEENPVTIVMREPLRQSAVFQALGAGYDFTLSASDTDPYANTSVATDSLRSVYLWGTCLERGLSAFEGELIANLPVLGFVPLNGILNAGSSVHLLLAVPECPSGPDANLLMGYWILVDGGVRMCLGPSSVNGILGAVDCELPLPNLWESPGVLGFASDGSVPCDIGTNSCDRAPGPFGLTQLTAVADDATVRLTWTTEEPYDGFFVYRRGESGEDWERLTDEPLRSNHWVDETVVANGVYVYRIGGIRRGEQDFSGPVRIASIRRSFVTGRAGVQPNPFAQSVDIRFSVAHRGQVWVLIYDVSGRLIRTLADGDYPAGDHVVSWDGKSDGGGRATLGVYFTTFEAGEHRESRKLVFLGK